MRITTSIKIQKRSVKTFKMWKPKHTFHILLFSVIEKKKVPSFQITTIVQDIYSALFLFLEFTVLFQVTLKLLLLKQNFGN